MSDNVLMINQGKLVLEGSLDTIHEQHHLMTVQLGPGCHSLPVIDGVLSSEQRGNDWTVVCNGKRAEVQQAFESAGIRITHLRNATLQEIFVASVGRSRQPEDQ